MSCLDDATVLGLVEGRLAPEAIARVDEHIDGCASCRDVVTLMASARSPARVLARGDTVGRYVVGDLLGAGAMGRVYSAWEPELDRRVAIKVLHEQGSRERLVKEAQAMARLNHPNVVTVHEVGSTDAGVFVAMELVDGETLRAWAEQARPWHDVARMLIGVARGLAAAHAAGVIHRDVKPDNVIVGTDGRTRLGDFGLARSGAAATASTTPTSLALGTGGTAVAGTPAYMAPEVLRGGGADAASDQFSFGVMAYELLAGRRPFAGTTWAELLAAIEQHEVRRIPDVPAWIEELVRRCLAVAPADRHPSMAVVADTLQDRAHRRRPVKAVTIAIAGALLASGATWIAARGDEPPNHDELSLAWNEPARKTLLQQRVSPGAIGAIDRWAQAWVVERDATRTSRDATDRIVARRRCLEQRSDELRALIDGAPRAPDRLLDAVSALPAPQECRNADADPLPADVTRASAAREVLAGIGDVRARVALATDPRVADSATQLVERARASGHEPTVADALLVRAEALRLSNHPDAALAARDAVAAAERGHADMLRARAWLTRVAIAGEQRDLTAAEDLGAIAQAAIDRVGAPHLAATLARLRGLIAYNRGRLDEARAFLLAARTQHATLGGERTLDIAAVDSGLGSVARAAGDLDEAERRHRAVLALDRELRGANHRDIARDLHNIAGVLRLRGNLDDALATYREALVVEIATQGERSVAAALTHNSIGLVELERRELSAAAQDFTIARDIFTAAHHGDRGFAEHNLGLVAQARGDHRAALAHFDAAAAAYAATIGVDAPAAQRLADDRAQSDAVLVPVATARPSQRETNQKPKPQPTPQPKPQPKRDVGVYGSAQSW